MGGAWPYDPGMTTAPPLATADAALAHGLSLLAEAPALAAAQAEALLEAIPGHPPARLLLGMARLADRQPQAALEVLQPLAAEQPAAPQVHLALADAWAALQRWAEAIAAGERALALQPALPGGWLRLGAWHDRLGQRAQAEAAFLRHVQEAVADPALLAAGRALAEGDLAQAEQRLRERLRQWPQDVAALRMLAELGLRLGRNEQAIALLEDCLRLAPGFVEARRQYALALDRGNRQAEALAQVDALLAQAPRDPGLRNQRAVLLGKLGDYAGAIALYEGLLAEHPRDPRLWTSLGHALKTEGESARAVAAYRRAIRLDPGFGVAWWSLANLKTVRLDAEDIAQMRRQHARADLDPDARLHLDFALGKALEDAGEHAESFAHYAAGNAARRRQLPYDAALNHRRVAQARAVYTREFFAARSGWGCPARGPIFVVGLPRAGSTLIEQILASHPQVEATMELPELIAIVRELRARAGDPERTSYHDLVAALSAEEARALGERYLARTAVHRRLGRPLFIDKMPNNFAHLGLLRLILPQAIVIDARRHPLDCGFSNFKQHFARGQAFSYDLADIGHYYADYVALMAHIDAVLPGWVHRVVHERLVADTEAEVRALLAHCGLPFDPRCLRPHETRRAVRTASAEQVRRPISNDAIGRWRDYAPWLGPLQQALGPVLAHYPDPPPGLAGSP